MTQSEVRDKLGEPLRRDVGYIVKDDAALTREIWFYENGWVMFRYDTVMESGPNPPPTLGKQSIPVPGANGNYGGGG